MYLIVAKTHIGTMDSFWSTRADGFITGRADWAVQFKNADDAWEELVNLGFENIAEVKHFNACKTSVRGRLRHG